MSRIRPCVGTEASFAVSAVARLLLDHGGHAIVRPRGALAPDESLGGTRSYRAAEPSGGKTAMSSATNPDVALGLQRHTQSAFMGVARTAWRNANGEFVASGMPRQVLQEAPLQRRRPIDPGGSTVCCESAVLVFDPGCYPAERRFVTAIRSASAPVPVLQNGND